MKYYLVKSKFGHVGRNKYLPLNIPVIAKSIREASKKAKTYPGVKRDHKDWCLEKPIEISLERYKIERFNFENDIYFERKTRVRLELFNDRLVDEANYSRINGIKTNKKKFYKSRDIDTIKFKLKKNKTIIKSFKEIDYLQINNYGGMY